MKPIVPIAVTKTPDGRSLALCRHDRDYSLMVDRQELMSSRANESERVLARLGCARIAARQDPTVLIGGLGMGFTLRETLDLLQPRARIIVAELLPEIVRWNREILGELNNHPLRDPRVTVRVVDVIDLVRQSKHAFDAILLDIDNGPAAVTSAGNDWLYGRAGIQACLQALHAKGCIAIWSATVEPCFERRLHQEGLHVARYGAPAYKGGKSGARQIWIASRDPHSLQPQDDAPPQELRVKQRRMDRRDA